MEKNVLFLSKIRETIAKISPRLTTMDACYVSETDCGFAVVVSNVSDLGEIAEALCTADMFVTYLEESNFLNVKENVFHTKKPVVAIQKIPISMNDALQVAKTANTVVVQDDTFHAVAICRCSPARAVLSDIALELCKSGLLVKYGENNNFIEFSPVTVPVTASASGSASKTAETAETMHRISHAV